MTQETKNCEFCNNKLLGKQKKYCSTKCCNTVKNKINQSSDNQHKKALSRKIVFVNEYGGACNICGYDENLAALCFHHIDETTKSYELDFQNLGNRNIASLKLELSKCQLLCHNCHGELHNPQLNYWHV